MAEATDFDWKQKSKHLEAARGRKGPLGMIKVGNSSMC